jgi:hypothetical protein
MKTLQKFAFATGLIGLLYSVSQRIRYSKQREENRMNTIANDEMMSKEMMFDE